MKARIKDLTISLKGEQILTFALSKGEDARALFDDLNQFEVDLSIKKYFEKRSLRANNYCWHLINEIAKKMHKSSYDIYLDMLKDYGVSELFEINANVDVSRHFKHFRELERYEDKIIYIVMVGSSEYNSAEMHRLIEGIVEEAKNLGIQTETPEEIERMVSLWRSTETKK